MLRSEATAHDFVMVRGALFGSLGGPTQAIVWPRVEYRASATANGWYRGSHTTIVAEVGMTVNMVRTAPTSLVAGGFVEAEKQHVEGAYDQTTSYRPIWAETHIEEGSDPDLDAGPDPDDSFPEKSKTSRESRSHSVATRSRSGSVAYHPGAGTGRWYYNADTSWWSTVPAGPWTARTSWQDVLGDDRANDQCKNYLPDCD